MQKTYPRTLSFRDKNTKNVYTINVSLNAFTSSPRPYHIINQYFTGEGKFFTLSSPLAFCIHPHNVLEVKHNVLAVKTPTSGEDKGECTAFTPIALINNHL